MKYLHILLVEDDIVVLNLLRLLIEQVCPDCQVVSTTDGASALTKLHDSITGQAFDLLLTDYEMPLMDGLELARAAKHISPETKVVLMTGVPDIATILTEVELINLAGILLKPFSPDELKKSLLLES